MSAFANKGMARRADAASAGDKRQKIVLAGLVVVLVAVLAWQVPKLMGGSGASSETALPVAASGTGTTVAAPAPAILAQALGGTLVLTPAEKRAARWIKSQTARDPFVPLVTESASSASATAPTASASSAPASAASAPAATSTPAASAANPTTGNPTTGKPATAKAAASTKVAPTAAVLFTNGRRQVVGVKQTFKVGDTTFRLLAVTRAYIKIAPVLGAFAGGTKAITVTKAKPVTVENTTTGVQYVLRYSLAMSAVPTSGGK
jgi:hypothetical protein